MKNEASLSTKKAPKWTTYFSGSPKKIKVIYRIFFYSQNKEKTCYATLQRIAQECQCSIDIVYQAIKMACSLGIIRKTLKTEIYFYHPLTNQPYFNKNVILTWLGDTPLTLGEKCFGIREKNAFRPSPSFQNPAINQEKNQGYIKEKELSKERRRKTPTIPFPLKEKINENLKNYPESIKQALFHNLQEKYQNKDHFLPLDFPNHIKRFKEKTPLKTCYRCHTVHNNTHSICSSCLNNEKYTFQLQESQRKPEITLIEEIQTPALKEIYLKLKERLNKLKE